MDCFVNILTVHTILSIVLLLISSVVSLITIQSYTIYSRENCKGENRTFNESVKNLKNSQLAYSGVIKSRLIQGGVWVEIENGKKFSVQDGNNGSFCLNYERHKQIIGIHRGGSVDMRKSALSLFTEPYFGGDELLFEGHELRLPYTLIFRSWSSTGGKGWTIHRNPYEDDYSKCLLPNPNLTNFYSVDYEVIMKSDLFVGSLYQGCWTRIQPPPHKIHDNLPGLILYDLNNRELFTNGIHLLLPIPMYVTSYSFTGKVAQNWTVYESNGDYSRYKCLPNVVNGSTPREHVLIFERNVIQVSRVRIGCDGDQDQNEIDTITKVHSSSSQFSLLNTLFLIFLVIVNSKF